VWRRRSRKSLSFSKKKYTHVIYGYVNGMFSILTYASYFDVDLKEYFTLIYFSIIYGYVDLKGYFTKHG